MQCSDPYVTVSDEGVAILVCESDRDGDSISDSQVRGGADGPDQYFHVVWLRAWWWVWPRVWRWVWSRVMHMYNFAYLL